MFVPEFSDKYTLQVVVPNNKENEAVDLIRRNSKMGKIFISPVRRAIDIESGEENEKAI
jgi:nitrogen regulatory protein P-II 1